MSINARRAAHKRRNYVRFPNQPFMDDVDGMRVNVTTRTSEAINVETISELLEAQHRVMKNAMQDIHKVHKVHKVHNVHKTLEPPAAATNRLRSSFEHDACILVDKTLSALHRHSWADATPISTQAYIVQVPKASLLRALEVVSDAEESKDDANLFRVGALEVGSGGEDNDDASLITIDAFDGWSDGEESDDDAHRLTTNVHKLSDDTIASSLPLYPMQAQSYSHHLLLNLRRRPVPRASKLGVALPTVQDLQQLADASLFYDAPVAIANLSTTSLCTFAFFPEFIRQLRDLSASEQRRWVDVMQHNTTVCLRKRMTPDRLQSIYRHLLSPAKKEEGALPVMWMKILPLQVEGRPLPPDMAPPDMAPPDMAPPDMAPPAHQSSKKMREHASDHPAAKRHKRGGAYGASEATHSTSTAPVQRAPWRQGDKVVYTQTGEVVTILKIHLDDAPDIYYTVVMSDGGDRQTLSDRLSPLP